MNFSLIPKRMKKAPEPVTRKSIGLPDAMWQAIADFRFSERIPSETKAVCQLVQAGLDAKAKEKAGR